MNAPYSVPTPSPSPHRPRVGLALSCGGARGLAHLGVIQVLEENDVSIDAIAGASMGAYVGSLFAAGYDGKELQELAAEISRPHDMWHRLDLAIPPVKGLFYGHGIRIQLERALHGVKFEELQRDLYVVATNIDTLERQVFNEGDVAYAVHASLAVPGLCVPVPINGSRYVDGGIVDPLPVGVLKRAGCDVVIAVSVIPSFAEIESGFTKQVVAKQNIIVRGLRAFNASWNVFAKGNVIDTLRRSISAAQVRLAETSGRRADILLRPVKKTHAWHDYHHFTEYIDIGRRAAELSLPAILALVNSTELKGDSHETVPCKIA